MTPADAAELLSIAAAFDRRTIGVMDAVAWADALDGLDPRECVDAVRGHFRDSTAYLMPAHVRERVLTARGVRVERERSAGVVRAIESARSLSDPVRAHEGYLAASRVLAERRAALGLAEEPSS